MKNLRELFVSKCISSFVILSLLTIIIAPQPATAATITTARDVMSRMKASTASDHTIYFVTPSGVASGGVMTFLFSADFTGVSSMEGPDFDLAEGDSGVCTTASFTEKSVVTSAPTASQFSIDGGAASTVTVTSGGGSATITAGRCVRLKMGLNATDTTGTGPGDSQISNGAVDDDDTITIDGSFGDDGVITVDIIDDDQVNVTASVNQSITFDLDDAVADTCGVTDNGTPYDVALGTITTADTRVSGATDGVALICLDIDTNASGGAVITVRNANGANGLVSTSTPADNIASTDGALLDNTENYGLCALASTASTGSLDELNDYLGNTCAANSETNDVAALSSTGEGIFDTNDAPIAGGRGSIAVGASITGVQPAHSDYADTLTFIATGTF